MLRGVKTSRTSSESNATTASAKRDVLEGSEPARDDQRIARSRSEELRTPASSSEGSMPNTRMHRLAR